MLDPYYSLPDVSNSDLSWLQQQLYPRDMPDPTSAYRFGTLIDAMITEPERVNTYNRTCDDEVYDADDFALAMEMRKAFYRDDFCRDMVVGASTQEVMRVYQPMTFNGMTFNLHKRCKWDLWRPDWGWGGDIKSTTAETQKQFEEACRYFDYDRQRAWYMDIAGSDRDILIGISKKNLRVFKLPITRQTPFFKDGQQKMLNLAYRHFLMFGEWKKDADEK